jgi:hypothetical protein
LAESVIPSVEPESLLFELCDRWMQSYDRNDRAIVEVAQNLVHIASGCLLTKMRFQHFELRSHSWTTERSLLLLRGHSRSRVKVDRYWSTLPKSLLNAPNLLLGVCDMETNPCADLGTLTQR